eukprot:scaffold237226_cov30-Tisochrysis_lutea.AAC.2
MLFIIAPLTRARHVSGTLCMVRSSQIFIGRTFNAVALLPLCAYPSLAARRGWRDSPRLALAGLVGSAVIGAVVVELHACREGPAAT